MKKILFICRENAARSQMAAAFLKKFSPDSIVDSAGSSPADKVEPFAVEAMREKGIDISRNKPKKFTQEMGAGFDFIVTMGCGDECPITDRQKTVDWDMESPKGKPIEKYRQVRDQIEKKARNLWTILRSGSKALTAVK